MASRQPYLFIVVGGLLRPFDAYCGAKVESFGPGAVVKCSNMVQPRAIPFHNSYWATLTQIVEATEIAPTADHLHDALVKLAGFVSVIVDVNGKPVDTVRNSTAFDAMDEPEFHRYVMLAQRILAERFGVVWDDYTKEANAAVSPINNPADPIPSADEAEPIVRSAKGEGISVASPSSETRTEGNAK